MNEVETHKIYEKVKEFGVTSVRNFLNTEQFKLADNALKNISEKSIQKGDERGYFPTNLKANIIKIAKFEFKKIRKAFVLKKIAQDLQLEKITEKIFNHKVELNMIDSYYSKRSDKNILDWHNDINYRHIDATSIKFFIYMTDVESENGSLAYVPYSHHVVRAVTSLMLEKKIEHTHYWKLEDLRALVLKSPVKNLIIDKIGAERLSIFLNNSKFIEQNTKDTFKFDFEMNKGSAVIFDELGVHRGSKVSKHGRLVLRYFYRRKI